MSNNMIETEIVKKFVSNLVRKEASMNLAIPNVEEISFLGE